MAYLVSASVDTGTRTARFAIVQIPAQGKTLTEARHWTLLLATKYRSAGFLVTGLGAINAMREPGPLEDQAPNMKGNPHG